MNKGRSASQESRRRISRFIMAGILVCGLLLIVLMPPFTAPDERIHFANIWAISNGSIFPDVKEGQPVRWLPESYRAVWNRYPAEFLGVDNQNKYSWEQLKTDLDARGPDSSGNNGFPVPTAVMSLGYCFPAAGMIIFRLLGSLLRIPWLSGIYAQLQAGRMANLIFYALVSCFALQRSRFFPRTAMLILCMPMSLYLGASLSYDAVIIPVSIYWFSLILSIRGAVGKKVQSADRTRLVLSGIFLVGTKPVYGLLLFFLFFIQEQLFRNQKHRGLRVLLFIAGICFLGMLPAMIQAVRGPRIFNPAEEKQLSWLAAHIPMFPAILIRTAAEKIPAYAVGFWGNLGWLDVRIPYGIVFLGMLVLLLVSCYEAGTFSGLRILRWHRVMILGGMICSFILFALWMYVTHSSLFETGGGIVKGIQGRYFIPCFLPLVFAFQNNRLGRFLETRQGQGRSFFPEKGIWITTVLWCMACELITVLTIAFRYWF
ncbi:MAG: DUF2142 domain-containing protein [Clostridia bacterium]|nr:DUF2142 domain-containing protein [Clostridia bacterium]